jgi:hypothetical protein
MGSGKWWVVITSLMTIAVYAIGSAVWVGSGDGFYRALETPPWQPPDAMFGIAWTYNFVMLAVVAIQVARHGTRRADGSVDGLAGGERGVRAGLGVAVLLDTRTVVGMGRFELPASCSQI